MAHEWTLPEVLAAAAAGNPRIRQAQAEVARARAAGDHGRAAAARTGQAAFALRTTALAVRADAATAFWDAVEATGAGRLFAAAAAGQQGEVEARVLALLELGLRDRLDLLRAKEETARLLRTAAAADHALARAARRVAALADRPDPADPIADPLTDDPAPNPRPATATVPFDQLWDGVRRASPELRTATLGVAAVRSSGRAAAVGGHFEARRTEAVLRDRLAAVCDARDRAADAAASLPAEHRSAVERADALWGRYADAAADAPPPLADVLAARAAVVALAVAGRAAVCELWRADAAVEAALCGGGLAPPAGPIRDPFATPDVGSDRAAVPLWQ